MRRHAKAATAGSNLGQARGFAAVLGAALLLALLTAPAAGAVQQEKLSSFGPDGTAATDFEHVGSVAVDQADGSVYVLDSAAGELFRFGPDGEPRDFAGTSPYIDGNRIEGLDPFDPIEGGDTSAGAQVAVDASSHAFYLTEKHAVRAFQANGEAAEFTAGPGENTSEIPGFGELFGVAVDANGNIYASDRTGTMKVFTSAGAELASFSALAPRNLAVDSAGVVYVLSQLEEIKTFNPSESPVSTTTTYTEGAPIPKKFSGAFIVGFNIDPLSGTTYLLETSNGKSWVQIIDKSGTVIETIGEPGTPREGEALGGGSEGLAVLGAEIEVGPEERVKFFTGDTPETGESQAAAFGTKIVVGPPSFKSLRATNVTADSALLRAFVNPNTKPTTYRFEYGLEDCSASLCASVPVGGASIGEGSEPVAVAQTITGLVPATTYHYRVFAENELGESEEEGTFTTQVFGGSSELGDGRAWEMASPPDKGSATLASPALGLVQAAQSGNGVAYLSRGSIEADPDGNRSFEVSSVLSKRAPGGSWSSKDITPANSRVVPLGVATRGEYMLFDSELATALIEPHDGTQLSPLASERTPYLRENTEPPHYAPLVTGKEGVANVPPGTVFGGNPLFSLGSVSVTGANASMSDVVLTSLVPLVEGASGPGLYHWRAGQLEALSVLPEAEGGEFFPGGLLGSGAGSRRNAISEDGGRIFWSASSPSALYLRDTEAEETVRLDVAEPDAPGLGAAAPAFQGANRDGTVVFFKDTQQLTKDASPSGADLYRCEIEAGDSSGGCASLTDVTGATQSDGESAEVTGLLPGMSEDATSVYLVARGVLDTAPNGHGDSAAQGEPNLYLWQEGEGVRFIATLSEKDAPDWGLGETKAKEEVTNSSALASPGGRYLTFMSELSLTGQGNHDAETGNQAQQAFVYDADSDQLSCISCSPLGAAPVAEVSKGAFFQLVDPQSQWEGRWVSAIVPQSSTIREGNGSLYRSRAMLDNGRAFFHSFDSLVPLDTNHQWDVYEFEPIGVGGCSASSGGKAITRSGGGCVSLISSGTAEGEAAFLDASKSGDDAFFLTPARLSVLDKDSVLDVYDARVDGVPATLEPSAECLGEACQPAAVVPNDPTPASAGFKGQGNQKPSTRKRCAKGKRKARRGDKARCVTRKHKRAGQSRRAGR